MFSPPSRTALARYAVGCLFVVVAAGAVAGATTAATAATDGSGPGTDRSAFATATAPAGTAAVPSETATTAPAPGSPAPATATTATATPRPCRDDEYDPRVLPSGWTVGYVDHLSTDSLDRWTGGRVAPVGGGGDCSLFVADGERATLSGTAVDGSRGVVTGVLDLGANGSLRLVDAGSRSTAVGTATADTATDDAPGTGTPTVGDAPTLAIENRGPDFSTEAVVSVGNRSERVTLPSGRFFEFAVVRTGDGDVRAALWGAERLWDEEWDATFESVPETEWRVRVDGRAFLDGIAVGVGDRATPTAEPAAVDGDDAPAPTEDPYPGMPDGFEPGSEFDDPDEGADAGGSGAGPFVFGLLLVGFGALGVFRGRALARFNEQVDAIGSTTPASEVEPAEWNVALTKIVSAVVLLIGLGMLANGLL